MSSRRKRETSERRIVNWLPTTRKEMNERGWDAADVILFSGDAYVDHPAFGMAVIGRVLEAEGLRVAIVPQPDWHGDFRDFKKLGRPRLFFGISPGAMDSMVNKYTAARRLRSEDAYSPDGRHDLRPEYPTVVYTQILKMLWPDTPVIAGGIEASLRRVAHYDYWKDRIMPSILVTSGADAITYGMGEKATREIVRRLTAALEEYDETLGYDETGEAYCTAETFRKTCLDVPQTVYLAHEGERPEGDGVIVLHPYEECLREPRKHAENFRHVEEESNRMEASVLVQDDVVVNPPYPPMTTEEIDASFDLPYTRLPHPKYKGKRIPAYDMIRHSVTLHRGCFGGCAFCTISAHQGKFIASRSRESILREVRQVTEMPDFKGALTDLGGPSANMYRMGGKNLNACRKCARPSCIHPAICPNLNGDHAPLTDLYETVSALPGVKHCTIGSGVRYDMLLHDWKDERLNSEARRYTSRLITHHVSGRLKVAPEHTEDHVLEIMRKPSFSLFYRFRSVFESECRKAGLRQQLIPYFISSHPGCEERDMKALSEETRALHLMTDQVQDFTPTPLTLSTTIFCTGYHPYTMERVFCEHDPEKKKRQKSYFYGTV